MEDKNRICRLLLPALQETRTLHDLTALEYIPESGIVAATFSHKYHKEVNVEGDSGVAMVKDIVKRLIQ